MPEEEKTALISVKDLGGLSAPLTKLAETVGAVFGRASDAVSRIANVFWLASKDAQNEAERIRLVEGAKTQMMRERAQMLDTLANGSQRELKSLEVSGGEVSVRLIGVPHEVLSLQERAQQRIAYESAKQQLNIESAVAHAAAELAGAAQVAETPVDPDWMTRYFRTVQDISRDDAQLVFGKILAGEIKEPGSFSVRTIDLLASLSQEEGQTFNKLCSFVWLRDGSPFAIISSVGGVQEAFVPNFSELRHLSDIGLISFSSSTLNNGYNIRQKSVVLSYGDRRIKISSREKESDASDFSIDIGYVLLTQIGQELAIVSQPVINPQVVDYAIAFWTKRGFSVTHLTDLE